MARGFASRPPAQRRLVASMGGLATAARATSPEARRAIVAAANAERRRRLEVEADPEGVLPPDELAAAVDRLRRMHMRRMALASAASRRRAAA